MQRNTNFVSVTAAVALAVASLGFASVPALAGGNGITAAATGSGQLATPVWLPGAHSRSLHSPIVQARRTGRDRFRVMRRAYASISTFSVCMSPAMSQRSAVSLRMATGPEHCWPGLHVQVQDNGEGTNATGPDMISTPIFEEGIAEECAVRARRGSSHWARSKRATLRCTSVSRYEAAAIGRQAFQWLAVISP